MTAPPRPNLPRARRITQHGTFTWKRRLATFVGTLGTLWLLTDPLISLAGRTRLPDRLGPWAYPAFLGLALMVTLGSEYFSRRRALARVSFIRITIVLTRDGSQHDIEVPHDMLVALFVESLLNHLAAYAYPDDLVTRHHMYNNALLAKPSRSSGGYVPVPGNLTLREAGLSHGDVCKLTGTIKAPIVLYDHD